MKQEMLAPWAEPAPDAPFPMTVNEALALPDDGWQYELVEGRLVRMPLSGGRAAKLALRLGTVLLTFVEPRNLGEVLGADGGFDLTQPGETEETLLGQDVSFVRAEHVPPSDSPEYDRAWHVAPDLVVEIASPNQYHPEMAAKARRYLAAGVRLVWVIWPRQRQVEVWRPGADQPLVTLGEADALDGLDVLPGFSYPVAVLLS